MVPVHVTGRLVAGAKDLIQLAEGGAPFVGAY